MSISIKDLADQIASNRVMRKRAGSCGVCHKQATNLLTNPHTGCHMGWVCNKCWDAAYNDYEKRNVDS